jgi:hypothetical protein
MLPIAVQPSISTIHCKCLYSLANPVLPFPMFCSPNNSPTPSCPCALRSHGCHPEQSEGSAFLLFIRLARLPSFGPSLGRSAAYPEHRRPTNPFIIRTYGKCASNSFRIRTYKTQDLKPFRIRTYKKTGVGGRISSETATLGCRPSKSSGAGPCSAGTVAPQPPKCQNHVCCRNRDNTGNISAPVGV